MLEKTLELLIKENGVKLTAQQREAVLHIDGPCMVLAVPGAGKTTVLITRLGLLILGAGISPSNILCVTFSKSSAKDMSKRMKKFFGAIIPEEVHFSTIHSFAFKIVREYSYFAKLDYTLIEGDKDYRKVNKSKNDEMSNIENEEDEKEKVTKTNLLKKIYLKLNQSYINDDKLEELTNYIGYVKNKMMSDEDISQKDFGIDNFFEIYKAYEDIKRKNNYIDYDDMLTLCYEILQKSGYLLNKYRKQFPYIMCDEAQDTSEVQHRIIEILAQESRNIMYVCDDDQSIYGFRSAEPKRLLEFKEIYKDGKVFFMEQNFRSTKNIVAVSNQFIKTNKQRYNKELFTENEAGESIKIDRVKDEREQLNLIALKLSKVKDLSSEAILYRNNMSAIPIIDILERKGIPVYLREYKNSFFSHWVVQDIMAFFELAIEKRNIGAFSRIYYKMNSFLPKKAIEHLKVVTISKSVFSALKDYNGLSKSQIGRLSSFETAFSSLKVMTPLMAINYIENILYYKEYLEKNAESMGYSLGNLMNILNNLKSIASHTKTLEEFMDRIDDLQGIMSNAKYNRNKNAVTLSTIHSVKGLEFNSVTMIDLVDGQFPSMTAIKEHEKGNSELLEEERRVFFVGMTRAKIRLTLTILDTKNNERVRPSRFAEEVLNILYPKKITAGDISKNQIKFIPNTKVNHNLFGAGRVLSVNNNIISIHFDLYGVKTLSVELCVSRNLLRVA